jgi:hypothetical protein
MSDVSGAPGTWALSLVFGMSCVGGYLLSNQDGGRAYWNFTAQYFRHHAGAYVDRHRPVVWTQHLGWLLTAGGRCLSCE